MGQDDRTSAAVGRRRAARNDKGRTRSARDAGGSRDKVAGVEEPATRDDGGTKRKANPIIQAAPEPEGPNAGNDGAVDREPPEVETEPTGGVCRYCGSKIETRWVKRGVTVQQQEVMHVDSYGGNVIGNGKCQSDLNPLKKYQMAQSEYDRAKQESAKTLHYSVDNKIACGAAGGVSTSNLSQVTCKNCQKSSKIKIEFNNDLEEDDDMSTAEAGTKRNPIVKKAGAKKAAPKTKKSSDSKLTPCGCGCGETVARKFAVGHDARFHGQLKRVADGRMKLSELPAAVRKFMFAGKTENEKGVKPSATEKQWLESLGKEV